MKLGSRFIGIVLAICMFFVLFWGYKNFVYEYFSYLGFKFTSDISLVIEGLVITVLVSLILPVTFKKTSDVLINLHFLFPILPMVVMFSLGHGNRYFLYSCILCFLFLVMSTKHIKCKSIRFFDVNQNVMFWFLFVFSSVIVMYSLVKVGMSNFNLNIFKVYEYREINSDSLPAFFGYLLTWVGKVFIPICVAISLLSRRFVLLYLCLFLTIFLFGLVQHKSILIMPFFIMFVYFSLSFRYSILVFSLFFLLLILVPLSFSEFYSNYSFDWAYIVNSYSLRRVFFVPGLINYAYYEFFSSHTFTYWSESKLTFGLIQSVYDIKIPTLIGEIILGQNDMSANSGWIGSGFAQWGYYGLMIYTAIISLLLIVLNALDCKLGKRFVTAVSLPVIFSLFTSSDLTTVILTHGLIPLLFLLHLLSENNNSTRS